MPEREDAPTRAETEVAKLEQRISPRDFMRARRPELFSDTLMEPVSEVTRALLEYHLDSLTSRKQEIDFELFCHGLAEREICPNLVPQTGPTGGGDSGTDTRTHPVSDRLVAPWFVGFNDRARSELWAFAFSAKKKWRPKADTDIDKVCALSPRPVQIHFFTNQFVRDKQRAKVEGELTARVGVPVFIYDRTWIVSRVLDHGHIDLATDLLHMEVPHRQKETIGPNDHRRRQEFELLQESLLGTDRYEGVPYLKVHDYLRAARLARGLGRSRVEIDGYFTLARQVAATGSLPERLFDVLYQQAWTAYWWFEDIPAATMLYAEMEKSLDDTDDVRVCTLLGNLWMLLWTSEQTGRLSSAEAQTERRRDAIDAALERLESGEAGTTRGLHARTERLFRHLIDPRRLTEPKAESMAALAETIKLGERHGLFPAAHYINSIVEFGDLIGHLAGYDDLFEAAYRLSEKREGELRAGRLLLRRGLQELKANQPLAALAWLGRCRALLAKYETLDDLAGAMLLSSGAYEELGLLWAARMDAAWSAFLSLSRFNTEGIVGLASSGALSRLFWLELQLGRLGPLLAWGELATSVSHTIREGEERSDWLEGRTVQDQILGILLLRSDLTTVSDLAQLPELFGRLGFPLSRLALLYALGHVELLQAEGFPSQVTDSGPRGESQEEFFRKWRDQPAAASLPGTVLLHNRGPERYRTRLLGCEVTIVVPADGRCIILAESLLGSLEAFLARVSSEDLISTRQTLEIQLKLSDLADWPPRLPDPRGSALTLLVPTDMFERLSAFKPEAEDPFRLWVIALVGFFVAAGAVPFAKKDEEAFEALRQRDAFDRVLTLFPPSTPVLGLIGSKSYSVDAWTRTDLHTYPLQREQPWDAAFGPPIVTPVRDGFSQDRYVQHRHRVVGSLIEPSLWRDADWVGVGFLAFEGQPPFIGLMFRQREPAREIFRRLRGILGVQDHAEELRVSVVEKLPEEPHSYAVHVTSDPKVTLKRLSVADSEAKQVFFACQVHRMNPSPGSTNLRDFRAQYEQRKCYWLAPVYCPSSRAEPEFMVDLAIGKSRIIFREAAEITGENDLDQAVLKATFAPRDPPW